MPESTHREEAPPGTRRGLFHHLFKPQRWSGRAVQRGALVGAQDAVSRSISSMFFQNRLYMWVIRHLGL